MTFAALALLFSDLPIWACMAFAIAYVAFGGLLWSRMVYKWELQEGLDCVFVRAERVGTFGIAQTAAFLLVKLLFILCWFPCLLFKFTCITVGLLRARPVPSV